jgi:Type I phosphodiesterase / nucleotide pyrophosphatase
MDVTYRISWMILVFIFPLSALAQQQNIVLLVADGLRSAAVSPETAPTMARIRAQGVDFRNSHSLFPTVTTANASAIATGHFLGDTGDFGNSIYSGFPIASADGIVTPFIQNNAILAELNQHTGGNFIAERSLMAAARERGYLTAVLGKVGAVGIQDITEFEANTTIFFDDDTGKRTGILLRPDVVEQIKRAGLPLETPGRAQSTNPGKSTNIVQQTYYRDIVTKVILPHIKATGKPFMLVYWSSDPDGTLHSQLDSENELTPGINGPTSLAAIKVADDNLAAIMAALKDLGLESTSNVFVTADHGFSTISKQSTTSPAARLTYPGVPTGQLPPGFVAIDLAEVLGLPLHEPFAKGPAIDYNAGKHPRRASALLGQDPSKPDIAIAANGGADLIYLPQPNANELALKVVNALLAQDYVSGIFVDDALGALPGTLPLSTLRLKGGALTPTPSIVVNFRSFSTGCDRPLYCGALVSDAPLKQGQGMHGSLSRSDTANFMAAIGPAFKRSFVDPAPVSNADIAPTLAHVLGLPLPTKGKLSGRVATEALKRGGSVRHARRNIVSAPSPKGLRTIVNMQYVGETPYLDAGGFAGRTLGLRSPGN